MSWTDERVEQLKQHWMEGKSASQIASLLGHGLSRNAVIGKVHRLGLAGRARSPSSGISRPRRSAPSPAAHRAAAPRLAAAAPRMTRGATALALAPRALMDAEPEAFESVVVPMSLRVTIIELERGDVPLAARRPGQFRIPLLRIARGLRPLLRLSWRACLPAGPGPAARTRPPAPDGATLGGPGDPQPQTQAEHAVRLGQFDSRGLSFVRAANIARHTTRALRSHQAVEKRIGSRWSRREAIRGQSSLRTSSEAQTQSLRTQRSERLEGQITGRTFPFTPACGRH